MLYEGLEDKLRQQCCAAILLCTSYLDPCRFHLLLLVDCSLDALIWGSRFH